VKYGGAIGVIKMERSITVIKNPSVMYNNPFTHTFMDANIIGTLKYER
jgi:hypothetical protein